MASDIVTTVFGGDDSVFQAVAKRVRSGMAGIAAETAVASSAVKGLGAAFETLAPILVPLIGAATVIGGIMKAFGQASERQLAQVHFEAIGDNVEAATEKLEAFSHVSGLDFPELEKGVQRLMESGLSADEATDAFIRMQKVALNTGASAEEMGDIFARVMLKEEVSMKDLNKLAAAGIPGIAGIAKEFKNLEVVTKDSDTAIERQLTLLKRQYEQIKVNTAAVSSFGQSTGLLAAAFQAFRESGSRSAAGARVTEFAGVTQGVQELSKGFGAQFVQGIQQINKETGLSENTLREFIDAGKIGYQDLVSAAERYRDEQQKAVEQKGEDKKFANQQKLLEGQRALVGQVNAALTAATDPGGKFADISKYLDTWTGQAQVLKHNFDEAFEAFGAPLIEALTPLLKKINTDLMPELEKAAGAFGTSLAGTIPGFTKSLTEGLMKVPDTFGAAMGQALSTIASSFGKWILDALTEPLKPENWFKGMYTPQEPGVTATTPQEVTPSTILAPTTTQAGQQTQDKLVGLLETGNTLAETLNTNLTAILQTA